MYEQRETLGKNVTINCLVEAKIASKSHIYQTHSYNALPKTIIKTKNRIFRHRRLQKCIKILYIL